ncbi:CD180 antigen [Pelodytes ibericus]
MDSALYLLPLLIFCPVLCQLPGIEPEACLEVIAYQSYSCEGLGLLEIPDTIPSTTEILDFSFNSLYVLYDSTLNRLRNLTYLDLTRCNINWMYDNVFNNNDKLQTLVLTGNPILYIKDYAFSGSVSLKHLFLQQTATTNILNLKLSSSNTLESLHFGHNFISSLELPNTFPLNNLKTLDFQFNDITQIAAKDVEVISQVENLTLILKGNDINYIEPNSFSSSRFYSLDLMACGINVNLSALLNGLNGLSTKILKIGTFKEMERKFLVTPHTLDGLCNISAMDVRLQYTYFDQMSSATFSCFSRVQRLDLTNDALHSFPEFDNHLSELILNKNKLGSLCDINTNRLVLLTSLHVRGNYNDLSLGTECLKNLSSLQYLDLSANNIQSADCCRSQFSGLLSLKHLNYSYNHQHILSELAFLDNTRLEVLDLSHTPISLGGYYGPFANLKFLKELNMSHSFVNASNDQILEGLQNLTYLNIQRSSFQLGVIKNKNLLQHVYNLEVLILSSCEITAIEERAFSNLKKLIRVDLSQNKLVIFNSDAFGDLSHIYLNFAFNMISETPLDLIRNVSGTSVINLSHNPLDCSCTNFEFISWYKQNANMFEDHENTQCWSPQSSNGTQLTSLKLYCSTSTGLIFVIVLAVILAVIIVIAVVKYYRKKMYFAI